MKEVKRFVEKHKYVILAGGMLAAGVVIGRSCDISWMKWVKTGTDIVDTVCADVSTYDSSMVDLMLSKDGENSCLALRMPVSDAKSLAVDIVNSANIIEKGTTPICEVIENAAKN